MPSPIQLPTVMVKSGLQPQAPTTLWQAILAYAESVNPGITFGLPGSLIEDISSTDVASAVLMDSARVEFVDSVTPFGANAYILTELGNVFGVPQGEATNTSVGVIFSGTPNFVVPPGFTVGDGIYQYTVLDGGIIGQDGNTPNALTCVADLTGTWAVPPGTVTEIITSVPDTITLSCSNPFAGLPGLTPETESDYRTDVLLAGRAASQGMASYLKTLLRNVQGVQPRLVSVRQIISQGWEVLCGGGDPAAVAQAIYEGVLDLSTLQGSVMAVDGITNAASAVFTTVLNHGYSVGQVVFVSGVQGMTGINNIPITITSVPTEKTFGTDIDSTSMGAYTTGGVLTPNLRNETVTLNDYPDLYQVVYVSPPQQSVSISLLWNTSAINFVNGAAVQQLGAPALAAYVNSVAVGQPLNLYQLESTFRDAISSVLSPDLLTRMVFSVSINGVGTPPSAGTGIIAGDPESYFQTDPSGSAIVIAQG